jgi:Domain of unknown function (DUF4326)
MPTNSDSLQWTPRQLQLRERLDRLETVVVNVNKSSEDVAIVAWAQERGLLVYVGHRGLYDRWPRSVWANPYRMSPTATPEEEARERDRVCELFVRHLAEEPDLLARIGELKGKALGCWCAPSRCHADYLAELANALPWKAES